MCLALRMHVPPSLSVLFSSSVSALICQPQTLNPCSAFCLPTRYEDNFDAVNNVVVLSQPADKGSIDAYGSPEAFLDKVSYLFGKQTFAGAQGVAALGGCMGEC